MFEWRCAMVVSAYQGSFPDADAIPRHHGAIEHAGAVSAVRRADIHPSPVPQALEAVHAGFPSVAQDYFNGDFSLDEHIINHPDTTFVVTVAGDSMMNAGIWDGDLLVVDRALDPQDGDVVIAVLDDELAVKRLVLRGRTPILHPENPAYPDFIPAADQELLIWGVVVGNYHWQRQPHRQPHKRLPSVTYPADGRIHASQTTQSSPTHPKIYRHHGWGV